MAPNSRLIMGNPKAAVLLPMVKAIATAFFRHKGKGFLHIFACFDKDDLSDDGDGNIGWEEKEEEDNDEDEA